ncbi:LPS translocon maturation chaperone LptM [Pseudoxanthomonas taiwanensis]|jgi:hypothetical protein|uniref:Sugar transporter n=1 Tax=Pseudoxanthomonas taiwanensis TaxID=176598 RepID=A0A921NZ75_9GAMM|nr:lipoprotein [Pseudoxanthomonas taiwanensis]KAF1688472.1 hypothetical protein CR938_09865 [Pseudoxanthomonas taiwanensis]MBO2467411.1 hypothetical protein [Xanthomonadaceae bacterium]
MNIRFRLLAAVPAVLLLAACGNKGPLVMPQKPVPVEQTLPAPEEPAGEAPPPAGAPEDRADEPAQAPPATPEPAGGPNG